MLKVGFLLGALFLATPAVADPLPLSGGGAGVEGPAKDDSPRLVQPSASNRKGSFFRLFGIGAATTMVVTPATMALAAWMGTWSSNLYAALIPSLLLLIVVPPLVTSLVQTALGNALWGEGTFKLGWPLLSGMLMQAALVVLTLFIGLPGATVPGIAIFTGIDMILMAGTTSGVMWATRIEPMATAASRAELERGGSAGLTDFPRAPAAAFSTVRF